MAFGHLSTGVSDDLHAATSLARTMVTSFGMSDALGPVTIGEKGGEVFLGASLQDLGSVGPSTLDTIDREVERLVGEAEAKAAAMLERNWQRGRGDRARSARARDALRRRARRGALHRAETRARRARRRRRTSPRQGPGARTLRLLATGTLLVGVAVAAALASVGATAAARADATWRLEQPAPPAGATFKVPLGTPDDMEFYAPNEGLLSVEGNAVVPDGLFFWNGRVWSQLSTVCGGSGEASRIAWAGPDEFWVITEPSEPRVGSGLGLCHFKDGVVVGSYSTPLQSPDPFRPMDAAACEGPDDCWFAGIGSEDPAGQRIGAFHLHWDGTNLTSSYQPQGRGVSGLAFFEGALYESALAGTQAGDSVDPVTLATPEPFGPVLIHKLVGGAFTDANFLPFPYSGVPSEGSELLSAKADAGDLWFSGGGAASGPDAPHDGSVPSPPIAVHYTPPSSSRPRSQPRCSERKTVSWTSHRCLALRAHGSPTKQSTNAAARPARRRSP